MGTLQPFTLPTSSCLLQAAALILRPRITSTKKTSTLKREECKHPGRWPPTFRISGTSAGLLTSRSLVMWLKSNLCIWKLLQLRFLFFAAMSGCAGSSKCCILRVIRQCLPLFLETSPKIQNGYALVVEKSTINSAHKIFNKGSASRRKRHGRKWSSCQIGYRALRQPVPSSPLAEPWFNCS